MRLVTTLGDLAASDLGAILPHEHVAADLRPLNEREPDSDHPIEAIRKLIEPEVRAAESLGVTAIVEATPIGVGRRADAIEAISAETGMPFVVATGVYREPWVPPWIRQLTSTELTDWMLRELEDGISGTTTRAGWIKLSAGDEGMTPEEERILRAAARAAVVTGCTIGSHTVRADVVDAQLDVLESEGFPVHRFVWIHAQLEPATTRHLDLARRGCWIEYDGIGRSPSIEDYLALVGALAEAGYEDRVLLSQDSGCYDPGNPEGGLALGPYTNVHEQFIPALLSAGFDQEFVDSLTIRNPFNAFARL
jgi:phosphotriesterase-related protein